MIPVSIYYSGLSIVDGATWTLPRDSIRDLELVPEEIVSHIKRLLLIFDRVYVPLALFSQSPNQKHFEITSKVIGHGDFSELLHDGAIVTGVPKGLDARGAMERYMARQRLIDPSLPLAMTRMHVALTETIRSSRADTGAQAFSVLSLLESELTDRVTHKVQRRYLMEKVKKATGVRLDRMADPEDFSSSLFLRELRRSDSNLHRDTVHEAQVAFKGLYESASGIGHPQMALLNGSPFQSPSKRLPHMLYHPDAVMALVTNLCGESLGRRYSLIGAPALQRIRSSDEWGTFCSAYQEFCIRMSDTQYIVEGVRKGSIGLSQLMSIFTTEPMSGMGKYRKIKEITLDIAKATKWLSSPLVKYPIELLDERIFSIFSSPETSAIISMRRQLRQALREVRR